MSRVLLIAACMAAGLPAPAAAVSFMKSSMASASAWQFASGDSSVTLSSLGDRSAYQQLSGLQVGKVYKLSFDLGALSAGSGRTVRLTTTTTGNQVSDHLFNVGGLEGEMVGGRFVVNFTAVRSTQNFQFINREQDGLSLVLSNVQASLVPEPEMWGLMLGGFGLVGLAMRRRRPMIVVS
ncbi:PEPxxWA-CTERM sorting domain-containing protein [Sandarakinorhabdus sp.]|uniref:PEPxxWA-CTERM sorting domain-containing protein n=1 Tax=Sandarakinorhabdus sp. TaxID=1916663 RepID=UPI00286E6C9F|nr:PEPxxWA-CTERM sorting domain-containing protein [Sandarakinorhabdus sp.]